MRAHPSAYHFKSKKAYEDWNRSRHYFSPHPHHHEAVPVYIAGRRHHVNHCGHRDCGKPMGRHHDPPKHRGEERHRTSGFPSLMNLAESL